MLPVGIGATWLGYSVFYYGLTQVQGGNWGYFDLVWPTRWATHKSTPRDDGTSPVSTQQSVDSQLAKIDATIKRTGKVTAKQRAEITKDFHKLLNVGVGQQIKNSLSTLAHLPSETKNAITRFLHDIAP